jgi:hypothetical protein
MVDFLCIFRFSCFFEFMVIFALASVGFACLYHQFTHVLFNSCLFSA